MGKRYQTTLEVRGYELDSFGHVNHANYLSYLEFARWKMLEEEGVTLALFKSMDRFPVIAAVEIQYIKPVFMGDVLTIESELVDYKKSSLHIEQTIRKGASTVSVAKIRSVIVAGNGRPAELPEDLEKKWRAFLEKTE